LVESSSLGDCCSYTVPLKPSLHVHEPSTGSQCALFLHWHLFWQPSPNVPAGQRWEHVGGDHPARHVQSPLVELQLNHRVLYGLD
jgi:hypothetical protein